MHAQHTHAHLLPALRCVLAYNKCNYCLGAGDAAYTISTTQDALHRAVLHALTHIVTPHK